MLDKVAVLEAQAHKRAKVVVPNSDILNLLDVWQ
jgi:hypothetical protein